ncbi:hypothetical protein PFICI_05103 [Pestalotiopsis fici W106-1]|uniref:Small ribosomal subunit protein uS4m n=1 Tax=Pestalotiopsis fici (strain W106-1 / CGMCC3.15140) TaxID=1229662 RepID=W3XCU7_PESFW|nr:uncharacterized protein PFICI_05103 [Pestalotiopsis fici W106-1]ETS83227.1 hypothetical protein PFICI_05103 [Pestalotiopsis fici W106-1]
MAKGQRLHVLRRAKLRQSWNKYNLYNLWKLKDPKIGSYDAETFFQQKWRAKGMLRAYHGEHMKERDWSRMFNRRLLSVADMDPRYMAEHDGSEKAAGRGSGKDKPPNWNAVEVKPNKITPYMNMAFAPMERRLDIAIFRAMFASSARQARQFVIHGAVKVNGKKMPFPAYKLNPGDMFQVEPEKVLYATGRPKKVSGGPTKTPSSQEAVEEEGADTEEAAPAEEGESTEPAATEAAEDAGNVDRKAITRLVKQAKHVLETEKMGVAKKRAVRSFIKQARKIQADTKSDASPIDVARRLNEMMSELKLNEAAAEPTDAEDTAAAAEGQGKKAKPAALDLLTSDELKTLAQKMKEEQDNPYDPEKPYATPWRPKDFMSPFAFIPQYLEVDHKICSAVYLRHPVARQGFAEVPTPFGYGINQLAYTWYLRRR